MGEAMNKGVRLLRRVIYDIRQAEVAARCQVSRAAVSMWAIGERKPRRRHRLRLLREFEIPLDSWDKISLPFSLP